MRLNSTVVELGALAFWLGAAALFSAVVAPAVFAALPTRTLAGAVVGRVLPAVFYSGIALGGLLLGFGVSRSRKTAGLVILGACAVAQLFVAPRIERLRAEIGGPLELLTADDPRRAVFGRLHAVSVAWLGLAMLAAAVAFVLAARELRGDQR